MKYVVPNINIKTLGRTFHALAKLGDSLLFETKDDCVVFHAVNSSRSAYGCFRFSNDFFSSYIPGDGIKCKVSMKSCFLAFKSVANLEKHVEECVLEVHDGDDSLVVKFFCKHGVVKSFLLPFIDYELLNMTFCKEKCKNRLTAQSKLLADGIHNFLPTVEEVTLTINDSKVVLKNYIEDGVDESKTVHTELTLELDEFDNYVFDQLGDVTFCLKELKAILYFAEGSNLPISVNFSHPGEPIIFSINNNMGCETNFVFATINDSISGDFQSSAVDRKKSKSVAKKQPPLGLNVSSRSMSASMSVPDTVEPNSSHEQGKYNRSLIEPSYDQDSNINSEMEIDVNQPNIMQTNNQNDNDTFSNEDVVPTTPSRKRFKDVYLRYSVQNMFTSMIPIDDEILAPASDDDSD